MKQVRSLEELKKSAGLLETTLLSCSNAGLRKSSKRIDWDGELFFHT